MKIIINETYYLEQDSISCIHFNVMKIIPIQDKESPNFGKMYTKTISYGVPLSTAVHIVIMNKASDVESNVTLEEFVKIYDNAVNKLIQTLKK